MKYKVSIAAGLFFCLLNVSVNAQKSNVHSPAFSTVANGKIVFKIAKPDLNARCRQKSWKECAAHYLWQHHC